MLNSPTSSTVLPVRPALPVRLPAVPFGTRMPKGWMVAAAVLALALPMLLSGFQLLQATTVLIYAIALLGLNILTGYNGQISLGHGAFYAIGAYATVILIDKAGIPYWACIPIAGVVCGIVGFLFGLPAIKLEGLYLALATFALGVALPQMLRFNKLEHWTGGVQGIVIDKPGVPWGLPIDADQWLYVLVLAVTCAMFLLGWNLLRGRIGDAWIAVRDHPTAAAAMGINTAMVKSTAFGVSAFYTGVAGALSAITVQFVSPDSFTMFLSITLLVGVVIGGLASISGAIWGAIFIQFVPDIASSLSKAAPWAIYGVILIGFMAILPEGVSGGLEKLKDAFNRKRAG